MIMVGFSLYCLLLVGQKEKFLAWDLNTCESKLVGRDEENVCGVHWSVICVSVYLWFTKNKNLLHSRDGYSNVKKNAHW